MYLAWRRVRQRRANLADAAAAAGRLDIAKALIVITSGPPPGVAMFLLRPLRTGSKPAKSGATWEWLARIWGLKCAASRLSIAATKRTFAFALLGRSSRPWRPTRLLGRHGLGCVGLWSRRRDRPLHLRPSAQSRAQRIHERLDPRNTSIEPDAVVFEKGFGICHARRD